MRRRGSIFRDFREVTATDDPVVSALAVINANLKLLLEGICDIRQNTDTTPKTRSFTPRTKEGVEHKSESKDTKVSKTG